MPTKKTSSNKSSRRHLNTGSALNSRQVLTPASAEVGPSSSSTPSVSLRGDAGSAEVSSSLIGQPIMDTRGSVVEEETPLLIKDSQGISYMSLKDVTQPRSSHQVVYHKGHPT